VPEVTVRYRKGKVNIGQFPLIKSAIKVAVAEYLACAHPDGGLVTNDVEVFFHEVGPYDDCEYDLAVNVVANYYAERAGDKDERTEKIRTSLGDALQKMQWRGRWYIWVQLALASFREGIIE
jgi:hypothetical protein